MSLTLKQGPDAEPVSLAEAQKYLRIEAGEEENLISSLITAARLLIEAQTARVMITQVWTLRARCPASGKIPIPLAPVIRVQNVRRAGQGGALLDISEEQYEVAAENGQTAICLSPGSSGRFTIEFEAGFGAQPGDVPQPLRQAVMQAVAAWFEERGAAPAPAGLPPAAVALIAPYRKARL